MTQVTKAALLARVEALEKSLKRETALRKQEAGERKRLEKALADSVEQQTATSEILRVISSSPTDAQPVFESIAASAHRLCGAKLTTVFRFDGRLIHIAALHDVSTRGAAAYHDAYPAPPGRGGATHRAILTRSIVHIPDIREDPEYELQGLARAADYGSALSVPMLREGHPIGAITVGREAAKPFPDEQIELLRTFADQAVIAIENVRLFTELQEKNRAVTEAHALVSESLEQQTATSEMLKVISRSAFDLQPVFDTMAENAVRLCEAERAFIFRFDGELLRAAASYNVGPEVREFVYRNPVAPGRHSISARAALERRTVHIPDVQADPDYAYAARDVDLIRTMLAVPMLKADTLVGTITIYRLEVKPFTDKQVALVETFADQAVIAIENVRLFKELEARNRDLTATSQILQVISRSPTDVQPVFEAIADSAMRLFDALGVAVVRYNGELISMAAARGGAPGSAAAATDRFRAPHRPIAGFPPEQTVLTKTVHHVADVDTDPSSSAEFRRHARERGFRSVLSMPMLRGGDPVGVIVVSRAQPGPFSTAEVELLHTFADQAVIAIENVRLFTELEARNRDLTEALDQQTATSEILHVISRSQTDVQPVFDTIVRSAVRLCNGLFCSLLQFDGELVYNVAQHNYTPEALEEVHRIYPTRPTRALPSGRAILERAVVHIPDVEVDPDFQNGSLSRAIGWRSGLFVPMLRVGAAIGAIAVTRAEQGPFSDTEIELLKTFADQAVIAVENVRLFKELEART